MAEASSLVVRLTEPLVFLLLGVLGAAGSQSNVLGSLVGPGLRSGIGDRTIGLVLGTYHKF